MYRPPFHSFQMDFIAGCFYDGFVMYAKALEDTLAEGGSQNDGISITQRMQNLRFWGEYYELIMVMCLVDFAFIYLVSIGKERGIAFVKPIVAL